MSEENTDQLKEIINDYEQKEAASLKYQRERQQNDYKQKKVRLAFRVIGGIGAGLLITYLFVNVLVEVGFFRKKTYWNLGGQYVSDHRIEECIFKLWRIRQAVDLYYALNKEFPEDLKRLEEITTTRVTTVCAITQRSYLFLNNASKKTICCPDPDLHGVKGICMHWESGPPFIIR